MKLRLIISLLLVVCTNDLFAQDTPIYSSEIEGRDSIATFILVGDTQFHFPIQTYEKDNRRIIRPLLKQIVSENPAFTILLGDLVLWGSVEKEWRRFDAFAQPFIEKHIPLLPIYGNHEYYFDSKTVYNYFFPRFPDLDGQLWYVKKFRNIGIVFLNSNFDKLTSDEVAEQEKWYRNVLSLMENDTSFTHIIVCAHHAPFTNSSVVGDDEQVQSHFVEPFKLAKKTKIFFTGHCHSYEHFKMFGEKHFVVSGGAGPTQKLKLNTSSLKQDLYNGGEWRDHHYCRVTQKNEGLNVEMVASDEANGKWSVADSFLVK